MPAPQRRPTWRATPEVADYAVSKKRLDRLVRITFGKKKKPSARLRRSFESEIAAAVKRYVVSAHQHRGPTKGQILAALTDLRNAARRLDRIVRSVDDAAFEALLQQDGVLKAKARNPQSKMLDRPTFEANFWAVEALVSETADAARWLKGKSTPPKDGELQLEGWIRNPFVRGERTFDEFIVQLGEIFQRFSGKPPWIYRQWNTDLIELRGVSAFTRLLRRMDRYGGQYLNQQ